MKYFFLACLAVFLTLLSSCWNSNKSVPRVIMQTHMGDITVELYSDKAPLTVANFLRYVDEGAFDSATFYRSTKPDNDPSISVLQGGLWKPWVEDMVKNYEPPFAPIPHETTEISGLRHVDGVISMARLEPGTASSEFFICIGDIASLDFGGDRNPDGQGFAAFGRIIEGMDVVRAIHMLPTEAEEGFKGQLITDPIEIVDIARTDN